jgi:LysR family hydrogen peroxide-inducible transcriptional activator
MTMERLPTIKQLQHLGALARTPHFGRAASGIGITQSTLSASIRELEEVLGGPVVDRAGKQVRLTTLGEQVTAQAEKIVGELIALTRAAREQAAPLAGTLRLGVIPTISPYLLPRLLPGLRQRYPRLKLYLIEDQTARLLEQQERCELDVLLLALPCACPGEREVLTRDEFVTALRRDHPLASQKQISNSQLQAEKLLTLQDGHCLRDQILSACGLRSAGDERHAATSLLTLVQMVDNGLGITLVPNMAVKAGLLANTQLITRPLASGEAYRDIALHWRTGAVRRDEFRLLATEFKKLFRG